MKHVLLAVIERYEIQNFAFHTPYKKTQICIVLFTHFQLHSENGLTL